MAAPAAAAAAAAPNGVAGPPSVTAVQRHADRITLRVREVHLSLPAVLREVESGGGELRHLSTRRPTLDDVFIGLTGRSLREGEQEKAA